SAGPNTKASSAIAGARNVSASVASVPATNEPIAAVASAAAPRPARAILLPSSAVIIEPLSPGVLSRMEVVEPPYMAPYSTPANMMKAAVGATFTVTGSSSAMVSAGPMPGSTPTAVPSSDPKNAHIRWAGCKATPKPAIRESKASMSPPRQRQRAAQGHAQPGKAEPAEQPQRQPDDAVQQQTARAEGMRDQDERQHGGQREAQRPHGQQRNGGAGGGAGQRLARRRRARLGALGFLRLERGAARDLRQQGQAQRDQRQADDHDEIARADPGVAAHLGQPVSLLHPDRPDGDHGQPEPPWPAALRRC